MRYSEAASAGGPVESRESPSGREARSDAGPSDAAIIQRSLEAPEAFGELFDRHHSAIWSFAVSRVGRDDGADLASQVFVVAFEQRNRFDFAYESARPWLFGIASNLVRRRYRTRKRGAGAMMRLKARLAGAAVDPMADVDDRLTAAGELKQVRRALEGLPDRDREILLLTVVDGLSYAEVSATLGIPVGTVRSRLSRARRRLEERVAPSGQQHGEGAARA